MNKEWVGKTGKAIVKVMNRIFLLIISLILAFGFFAIGRYTNWELPWGMFNLESKPFIVEEEDEFVGDQYLLTISTVEEIIKPASDLITSRYIYKDADTYENYKELFGKKVPFTTDKVVFTYRGTVSVGIDLSDVYFDIKNNEKIIIITLPEQVIKSNEIDDSSFEYPFTADSFFNNTEMGDFTDLLATLKDRKAAEVKNDTDFMYAARQNTENVLRKFITAADVTKEYRVDFQ